MKALVLEQDRKLVYVDVEDPEPTPDFPYLVKIAHSGICGSDTGRAFHGKAYHYPLVMGHEFSGTVVRAPDGGLYPAGTRVAVFPLIPCGSCASCQTGDYAQCENYDYFGSRRDGGFAELLCVPEANLFRVPDQVDLASAAMTEPCAVALHGVEKLNVQAGMSALVIGGGPIGNMAAQWLKLKGCDPVYISDVDDRKLETASAMGLISINPAGQPLPVNVDCVVEACGLPSTFVQATASAGRFGQVVFLGNIHGSFTLTEKEFSAILRNELTIRGTWNSRVTPRGKDEWSRVLAFLDRAVQVKPLISHQPALSEGASIFDAVASRSMWYNKIVFKI